MTDKNERHSVDAANLPKVTIHGPLIDRLVSAVVGLIEARTERELAETVCAKAYAAKANIEALMTRQEHDELRREVQRLRQQNSALIHNKQQQRFGGEHFRHHAPPAQAPQQAMAPSEPSYEEQPPEAKKPRKQRAPKRHEEDGDITPFNGIPGLDKFRTANESIDR